MRDFDFVGNIAVGGRIVLVKGNVANLPEFEKITHKEEII